MYGSSVVWRPRLAASGTSSSANRNVMQLLLEFILKRKHNK